MILDRISSPSDIKKLSLPEIKILCRELRDEIIRITKKNGGHLGANLGSIELIVGSLYVFDCLHDRFIFDVGHQAYAYKLLTNRRDIMENLRQENGASGFINPEESEEYDHFISGHASNSLSASIGISVARNLDNKDFKVLTFLGDGSLSGGMIYEAMNNISSVKKNFIVLLNDNEMSISESVGSMRSYLSKLLSSKSYLAFRRGFGKYLSYLPDRVSKPLERLIKLLISFLKGHGTIFEEFGFQYIGPIDGNDIESVIETLNNIKKYALYKPVLLHLKTRKGHGYLPAEEDKNKMHGIDVSKNKVKKFVDVFEDEIVELARRNNKILCVTAAMKSGCGLNKFSNIFPDRFFDVGIAEEHAITFSAGLAKSGYIPYVCIYSTFLQRGFDQICHDVFLQNLPLKFIVDKSGFPGNDGKTHAGLYDISMFSPFIERCVIYAPSNTKDFKRILDDSSHNNKMTMIRFPKDEIIEEFECFESNFKNSRVVRIGSNDIVLILSIGPILKNILEAVDIMKIQPTIIDVLCLNPFEYDEFIEFQRGYKFIIIIEEGIFQGFASIFLEYMIKNKRYDIVSKVFTINATKIPLTHSSRKRQLEISGFSPENIAKTINEMVIKK